MNSKKILLLGLGIPLLLVVAIASFLILPWLLIFIGIYLEPNPPSPMNKHGEFPFHLVYEVDDKQYTIDDTIICDYAGIGMD